MTVPDPVGTLRSILGLEASITALVPAARIYAAELPASVAASLPGEAAIVLAHAGGFPTDGYARIDRPRIDVKVYAPTPQLAQLISLTVHAVLKQIDQRVAAATVSGVKGRIYGARPAGGMSPLRDETLSDTPMAFRSYELLVSELAIA